MESKPHIEPTALLEDIVAGKVPAFNQLFLEMYAPLYLLASQLTRNEEHARDIVSDVFLHFWENRTSLKGIKDVKAYLYVSTRHRTLDHLKKIERSQQREAKVLQEDWLNINSENFLQKLLGVEKTRILYNNIQTLPPECKKVILLGLEGYNTKEIANQLSISPSAVSNQKARAIKLLQEKLDAGLFLFLLFWIGQA